MLKLNLNLNNLNKNKKGGENYNIYKLFFNYNRKYIYINIF